MRIEYPGAWYHVMNRGRRREKIFLHRRDYLTFIELLVEASDLWRVEVAAFTLMPNHYHLLIHTPEGNLSRFMRHMDGVYTQRFNKNNKYEGQLFKGRFKSLLVDGDSYLIQLLGYIHRNPLRAKLVKNMDDYEWSSHQGYISKLKNWNWLYKNYMLSIFSDHKKTQLEGYRKFMGLRDKTELLKMFEGVKWPLLFGSDEFICSMKEKYYKKKSNLEIPESSYLAPDYSDIKMAVCQFYNIKENELYSSRRGVYNEPRSVAIYLSRKLRRNTLVAIGKEFCLNRYSSVSSSLNKTRELMKEDMKFLNRVQELETALTNGQT